MSGQVAGPRPGHPRPDPALEALPAQSPKKNIHHGPGALLSIYYELSVSNTSSHSTYPVRGAIQSDQYLSHPCFRDEEASTQRDYVTSPRSHSRRVAGGRRLTQAVQAALNHGLDATWERHQQREQLRVRPKSQRNSPAGLAGGESEVTGGPLTRGMG